MPLTDEEEIAQYEKSRAFLPQGPSYSTRPAVQVSPLPGVGPTREAAKGLKKLTQYQQDFNAAIKRSQAWKARMGYSMSQGEVDSRRGQGGGYALPGGQAVKMGPDIAGGDAYTAYDSRQRKAGMSPEGIRRGAMAESILHEGDANRGVPDAALTMVPGHGYLVDPRRQGINSVPVSAASAPTALSPGLSTQRTLNSGVPGSPRSVATDLGEPRAPQWGPRMALDREAFRGSSNAMYSFPESTMTKPKRKKKITGAERLVEIARENRQRRSK